MNPSGMACSCQRSTISGMELLNGSVEWNSKVPWPGSKRAMSGLAVRNVSRGGASLGTLGVVVALSMNSYGMALPFQRTTIFHPETITCPRMPWQAVKRVMSDKAKREDDDLAEDALEELFAQLERDLEEGLSDDEFTEEEIEEFENELEAALLELDGEEDPTTIDLVREDVAVGSERGQTIYSPRLQSDPISLEHSDERRVVPLEPWQLKKLAAASQLGRRHSNIKALAAEVGLDRGDVLAFLKDPPPELLMASMDLEEDMEHLPTEVETSDSLPTKSSAADMQNENDNVSSNSRNWYSQKRLRKEHEATLELVFRRTHRPTNAMIQNLVELTHLSRKRIVGWFENRRKIVKPSPKFEALR